MKEFVTNNYAEVAEIEVLEDSYEDQEEYNIVLHLFFYIRNFDRGLGLKVS